MNITTIGHLVLGGNMKRLLAAVIFSISMPQAHAWGAAETAAVLGFIGGAIVMGSANQAQAAHPPQVYVPAPVYSHTYPVDDVYTYQRSFRPSTYRVCTETPLYDHYGRVVRVYRSCRSR